MTSTYGFMVRQCHDWTGARRNSEPNGKWEVCLPHECDEWRITAGHRGEEHAAAVAALEEFIAEAAQALAALKERREYGNEEDAQR
ncbi:hypothetical protein DEJ49_33290 [Streptomyces venezuelae]|uniref:Uncharacterized protein n=1 Tax=Streptomyces venezuelae TaxID=54571 RepID=A0A5P2CQP1_STRVZ|nr:hypothetical protein [Streptomyces venezuelae]QES45216.1 hypothetical protein DEJ49_33290 [Streptomyces venezuelae]